jgi:hypothetical protein
MKRRGLHGALALVWGIGMGFALGCGTAVSWAQSTPIAVTPQNLRSLLVQALQHPQGEAHGVLSGPEAQAIQRQFGATGPLRIDVRTVKRFAQPGCARLEVTFSQDHVKLPDASAPRSQTVAFGINFCLDGRPPGAAP